ncbi:MAG: TIGR04283 family arsenosugar biosynthesis glycosyltransferase [Stenomitos frigidus ULC029]
MERSLANQRLSVIIPTLNEAENLPRTLKIVQAAAHVEAIVVDGGSGDATAAVATALGARVLVSTGGRAQQMNAGAGAASGSILLFLHADTELPPDFDVLVQQTLLKRNVIAGAFALKIDGASPWLRVVEDGVKVRSRWFQMPYGDQAIFLKASVFQAIGGFPALPIMEDFAIMQTLKRRGKIAIAPAAVLTSGRRWQKLGVWRTTLINQWIILGYRLGVSPDRLAHWYHQQGKLR